MYRLKVSLISSGHAFSEVSWGHQGNHYTHIHVGTSSLQTDNPKDLSQTVLACVSAIDLISASRTTNGGKMETFTSQRCRNNRLLYHVAPRLYLRRMQHPVHRHKSNGNEEDGLFLETATTSSKRCRLKTYKDGNDTKP